MFRLDFSLASWDFTENAVLFELPNLLRCEIRRIDGSRPEFEARENYAARSAGPDFALEAELAIPDAPKPKWKKLRIGSPLGEFSPDDSFCWQFDGHALQLFRNGDLLNEDYVCSEVTTPPRLPEGALHPAVKNLRLVEPLLQRNAAYPQTIHAPIHLWEPPFLNAWVGDVATFTGNGEYHLFFLFDRRHHAGKGGCGGHYWAHLVSRDLKTWRDDGLVLGPENLFQTFGTGTPFLLNGQLAIAYGLHTSRLTNRTMTPLLRQRASENHIDECDFAAGNGLLPEGATYAVSPDGVYFLPSHKLFHWAQNPSVFQLPDGRYRLFGGYSNCAEIWETTRWGAWEKVRSGFPPSGEKSFIGNCLDCPDYFFWRGTHYLLVGFSGMWMAQDENFKCAVDLAERGEDLYDGLCVPMVSPHPADPDRRILAGWLPIGGWGGVLGMRELVRHPDGVIGSRWLEEAMPAAGDRVDAVPDDGNFYFETELGQTQTLRFEGTGKAAEFRFDSARAKAQLCPADSPEVPTARERALNKLKTATSGFAVGKLRLPQGPTPARFLVRHSRKWQGSVVDVEIAGCRTLIAFFAGLKVSRISGGSGSVRPIVFCTALLGATFPATPAMGLASEAERNPGRKVGECA